LKTDRKSTELTRTTPGFFTRIDKQHNVEVFLQFSIRGRKRYMEAWTALKLFKPPRNHN
jgi:hypothetical protein